MKMHLRFVLPALAIMATAGSASASIIIDDFSTDAAENVISTVDQDTLQQSGAGIIGGQRDVLQVVDTNPFGRNSRFAVNSGVLFFEEGSDVSGSLTLDYDGDDVEDGMGDLDNNGGLSLDLTSGLDNGFAIDFEFADQGLQVFIDAYTGSDFSTVSGTVADIAGAQTLNLFFSDFVVSSGAGVDLTNVTRLVVRFEPQNAATDFAVDTIRTSVIPGPAAGLAFASGLIAARRRRSRKA